MGDFCMFVFTFKFFDSYSFLHKHKYSVVNHIWAFSAVISLSLNPSRVY